jgi:hypothetical protein
MGLRASMGRSKLIRKVKKRIKNKSKQVSGLTRIVVGKGKLILTNEGSLYVRKFPYVRNQDLVLGIDYINHRLEVFDASFGKRGYIDKLYEQQFGYHLT